MVQPLVIDVALLVLFLEALGFAFWRQFAGRGPEPRQILPNLAAGALLLLALRSCTAGTGGRVVLLFLGAALLAHLVDLRSRWPR